MDEETVKHGGKEIASDAERGRKYRQKNPEKAKRNNMKLSVNLTERRLRDDSFDRKFKEAARERKRKSRAEKKKPPENVQQILTPRCSGKESSSSSGLHNLIQKSRQGVAGFKKRRKNLNEKNDTLAEMEAEKTELNNQLSNYEDESFEQQLKIAEMENKLKQKDVIIEDLKIQLENSDLWLKMTYQKMGPVGKREFKTAFAQAMPDLPRGTISRLRSATGINFSNPVAIEHGEVSELKKAVEKFAFENSNEVPDMRKEKKQIRYYFNYLICLHTAFLSENPDKDISYAVFCSYWPKNIIKPKIEDYGTCKCEVCENIELKLSALKKRGLISNNHDIQAIIRCAREGNMELDNALDEDLASLKNEPKAKVRVSYLQWEKVERADKNVNTGEKKKKIMNRVPKAALAETLAILTKADFEKVKEHLKRNLIIRSTIKKKRAEISGDDKTAMLQIDWAENGTVVVPSEVQSAFYGGRLSYNLHTGYKYSNNDSGGFVSLSLFNNHKAEAISTALDPTVKKLVDEGKTKLIFVSDSPTSQYRNCKMVYLTKSWAIKYNISINWLYTEAGHGKSAADGIGGNIKNLVNDKLAFNTEYTIKTMEDIVELIKDNTTIELLVHTEEEVKKVADTLPKLSSLNGALSIHELLFEKDGKVFAKKLPSDPIYFPVEIKTSRRMRSVESPEQEVEMMETSDPEE
jgi:hypothetical protein